MISAGNNVTLLCDTNAQATAVAIDSCMMAHHRIFAVVFTPGGKFAVMTNANAKVAKGCKVAKRLMNGVCV